MLVALTAGIIAAGISMGISVGFLAQTSAGYWNRDHATQQNVDELSAFNPLNITLFTIAGIATFLAYLFKQTDNIYVLVFILASMFLPVIVNGVAIWKVTKRKK